MVIIATENLLTTADFRVEPRLKLFFALIRLKRIKLGLAKIVLILIFFLKLL